MQLWAVNDTTDCLVMLQQGQVDAISTDDAILVGLAAQDPNTKIVESTRSARSPTAWRSANPTPTSPRSSTACWPRCSADGTWTQIYDTYLQAVHRRHGTRTSARRRTGEHGVASDGRRGRRADRGLSRRARQDDGAPGGPRCRCHPPPARDLDAAQRYDSRGLGRCFAAPRGALAGPARARRPAGADRGRARYEEVGAAVGAGPARCAAGRSLR